MKKLITKTKYKLKYNYYADDSGHIWSEVTNKYLTEYNDKNGYKKVVLMTEDGRHRFSVHRLILETFYPVDNMRELQVDHIDGDINNNSLKNLRWTTCKENLNNPNTKLNRRVYDQDGTHNASSKFDIYTLTELVKDINSGNFTRKEICNKYSICKETLRNIVNKIHYTEELKDFIITPNFKSDYIRDTKGEKNGRAKLNEEQVLEIVSLLKTKQYSYKQIADKFNVSVSAINNIANKKTWLNVTKNIQF